MQTNDTENVRENGNVLINIFFFKLNTLKFSLNHKFNKL